MNLKPINFSKLTESERLVYEFINDNYDNLAFTKAVDIAKETFTSTSCVVRLCKKMGFSGYKSFQKDCIKKINQKFKDKANCSIFNTLVNSLKSGEKLNQHDLFEQTAKTLSKANHIWIYGAGINKPICKIFEQSLLSKGYKVRSASFNNNEMKFIKRLSDGDAVVFISYSGKNKKIFDFLNNLNKKVYTLAITSVDSTKLIENVNNYLLIPNVSKDFIHFDRIVRMNKLMVVDEILSYIV